MLCVGKQPLKEAGLLLAVLCSYLTHRAVVDWRAQGLSAGLGTPNAGYEEAVHALLLAILDIQAQILDVRWGSGEVCFWSLLSI